ncbi:UNVERIFIED_CONTAM: hypothetical protein Slati_0226500 [Sesamum latifolium]|uniref:Reverse transcriptase zinc-binding domain-containing protein n=1 Tax=Sesamum latifolium TaxID=2727402 RepID=A0AAW2YCB2_9LAMI
MKSGRFSRWWMGVDCANSSPGGETDRLCWHFDTHGHFLVKSGYQVARATHAASSSSHRVLVFSEDSGWIFIWRTRAAPKVLLFAWKCCKGVVPPVSNLQRRGVMVDSSCVLCGLVEGMSCTCWRNAPTQGSVGRWLISPFTFQFVISWMRRRGYDEPSMSLVEHSLLGTLGYHFNGL